MWRLTVEKQIQRFPHEAGTLRSISVRTDSSGGREETHVAIACQRLSDWLSTQICQSFGAGARTSATIDV